MSAATNTPSGASSGPRKITYSSDFKLEVLNYYFKHGGDEKFGLKKKTARHFKIDKKTISRMLNNPEMVKRARRLLARRVSNSTSKPSSKAKTKKKVAGGGGGGGGSKPSGTTSSTAAITSANSGGGKGNIISGTTTTTTTTTSSARVPKYEGVTVIDLPEDPDYSILKKSIDASVNGVGSLTKLLVTATDEVQQLLLNECQIILECQVCRSLFRSVVNFLAHKRIYCQEKYRDVRTLFHGDNTQGVTSQSGTMVVEPEPPPPTPPPAGKGEGGRGIDSIAERLGGGGRKGGGGGGGGGGMSSATHSGSSSYYERLQAVSNARDKLSSACSVVLEDIRGVTNARYQTFLPHTTTTTTTATPPQHMSQLLGEVSRKATGVTMVLGERGQVIKTIPGDIEGMDVDSHPGVTTTMKPASTAANTATSDIVCTLCNTRFSTPKTLSVHQRSVHGLERYIYSCPICHMSFFTMWGIVKHLERTHKKSKQHIERLKKVILKNMSKKRYFPTASEEVKEEEEEERLMDTTTATTTTTTTTTSTTTTTPTTTTTTGTKRKRRSTAVIKLNMKRDEASGGVVNTPSNAKPTPAPEHRCDQCERRFMAPQALISHKKFCSLKQMKPQPVILPQPSILPKSPLNPRLDETPEKRIAIQIRKDYKKPSVLDEDTEEEDEDKDGEVVKLQEVMSQLCQPNTLTCIPCGRKYQTVNTLKRHLSCHFNWTRYVCRRCPYRSYNRYELTKHAVVHHGVPESAAHTLAKSDVKFGALKYFLATDEKGDTPDMPDDEGTEESTDPKDVIDETDAKSSVSEQSVTAKQELDEEQETGETEDSKLETDDGTDPHETPREETDETNYLDQTELSVKKPDRTYSKRTKPELTKQDGERTAAETPERNSETDPQTTPRTPNGHLEMVTLEKTTTTPENLETEKEIDKHRTPDSQGVPDIRTSARRRLLVVKQGKLVLKDVGQALNGTQDDSGSECSSSGLQVPHSPPGTVNEDLEDIEREGKVAKVE